MSHPDVVPGAAREAAETSTRDEILRLIMTEGPITAAELAERLELTSAAIRRHILGLESEDMIAIHQSEPTGARGRPARRYVASDHAQSTTMGAYSDMAVATMRYLSEVAGTQAVEDFANQRLAVMEARYAPLITADDVPGRVAQLSAALSDDGFAASARPVPGTAMIQLCQGHCPIAHVAAEFPEFCEAEVATFSRLIGSHVQRLVTLAGGGRVCTTNVPVNLKAGPPLT